MAGQSQSSKRRTSASRGTPRRSATVAVAPTGPDVVGATSRAISWRHCLLGVLVGEVLLLVLTNGGLAAANAAFGSAGTIDGGIVGVATLLAVVAGGYLAARLAGRFGLYQGIVVAIGFIAVGALYQFLHESQIIAASISAGGHQLVDLGPMDMGNLFSGDLLALFGGSVGGLISGKR